MKELVSFLLRILRASFRIFAFSMKS